ncbi:MAG: GGDEF domain-containing protein [Rubrivivax sp.]
MLSSLTATEVAFLQVATVQAVAALVWGLGAWFVPGERRAIAHWSAYAAFSAVTWVMLALYLSSPPPIGVLVGVLGVLALRRGIQIFIGQPPDWQLPAAAIAMVLLVGLAAYGESSRPYEASLNFALLSLLYASVGLLLRRHARGVLKWRVPVLRAVPALLGSLAFGSRALRAWFWPESVLAEMSVDSGLNVASAVSYIVLVLLMHGTLMTLVVARLVNDLQRLARRDGLTGLLNRRAMHDLLDTQARLRRRAGDCFSVLMIDVDHFKAVNDRHGHATGDRALTHIARLMTQALRAQDRLGRLGGEEFLVLLPGADLRRGLAEAERLRLSIRATPLRDAQVNIEVALTISIGVAEWAGTEEDASRLLARADEALYRAKHLGRDRVEAAQLDGAGRMLTSAG